MDELSQIKKIKNSKQSRAYVTGLHSTPEGIRAANFLLKYVRKTRRPALFALVVFPDIDRLLSLGSFAAVKAAWPIMAKRLKKHLPANSLSTQTQFGLFIQVWDPKAVDKLVGGGLKKLTYDLNKPLDLGVSTRQVKAFTIKSYAGYLLLKEKSEVPADAETLLSRLAIAAVSAGYSEEPLRQFNPFLEKMQIRQEYFTSHLSSAIQDEFLGLRFQPRFSANNTELCGAQATLAWQDLQHGQITATELENAYRLTGSLPDLVRLSIKNSIKFLKNVEAHSGPMSNFRVSISVPLEIFHDPNFDLYSIFSNACKDSAVDAKKFCLEFEGSPQFSAVQYGRALNCLKKLHRLPVKTCLSFYQNLVDLNLVSAGLIAQIKWNMSSATSNNLNTRKHQLGTVVAIAAQNKLELIIEGVDSSEQAALLDGQKIDCAQGNLFSEPLSESFFLSCFKYSFSSQTKNYSKNTILEKH